MEDKAWFKSKTIWGALITVGAQSVGAESMDAQGIEAMSTEIVTLIGAALAIYGRFTAKTGLKAK